MWKLRLSELTSPSFCSFVNPYLVDACSLSGSVLDSADTGRNQNGSISFRVASWGEVEPGLLIPLLWNAPMAHVQGLGTSYRETIAKYFFVFPLPRVPSLYP